MEALLEPTVFFPVTIAVGVVYFVLTLPRGMLRDWWQLLMIGFVLLTLVVGICSLLGLDVTRILTFQGYDSSGWFFRLAVATSYICIFSGCGAFFRSLLN